MITSTSQLGTVLIVDDTPGNLALLSDMLSEAGYRVLVATDGLSAIEQIRFLKPNIILLDVMMPGIDGFETCQRLKANPHTSNIPILFMTGMNELDYLLRGFEEGAMDYIVKPIRPAEVLARIEVHLCQSRNLIRAERLLNEYQLAAIAVNDSANIIWLTDTAMEWLKAEQTFQIGDLLPQTMRDSFFIWRQTPDNSAPFLVAHNLIATFSVSSQPNEHLLLLQRGDDNILDPQALKEKLKITFREAEILMWIARGKTNKEIGIILNTSPRTVNKHLEHVFEKLGVSTRTAAAARVFS